MARRWTVAAGCIAATAAFALSIMAVPAAAAAWDPVWEQRVGPVATLEVGGSHVAVDARGNVYVAATISRPAHPGFSASLARYTPNGGLVWRRTWRGHGFLAFAMAEAVAVSTDRRVVYVGGAITDESTENHAARLWAFAPTGERRWVRPVPGAAQAVVLSVAPRADGAVVGVTGWGECGPTDGSVAALGTDGSLRWTDPFEMPGYGDTGDAVRGVAIGVRGRVYVVGSVDRVPTSCEAFSRTSGQDVVVAQLTAAGRVRSFRTYPRFNEGRGGSAWEVTVDADRVFVVGGAQRFGQAWLASLTPDGSLRWSLGWGPDPGRSTATGVAVSPWGSLYVLGEQDDTMFLRSYSGAGELSSVRLLRAVEPSGVATGPHRVVYVTGDRSLWGMPA
jgi:hypothetical protein